jgi:pimeloyl-ACP methyl ester carboxylesterase
LRYIDFRGKKIHYQVSGKGPAIVLLHGFLESAGVWKNFVRRLKDNFLVITLDFPGHGKSEPAMPDCPVDLMAEAVHEVLKSTAIRHCVMVGHSMGGYVALAFADKYPRMVKGLVLFHSQAGADSPEARANRERTIALVQKDHHGFIKNFIPDLFDPDNVEKFAKEIGMLKDLADETPKEGIIATLEGMKNRPDRQHVLMNAKFPILFIIGKNDKRIPLNVIIPQTLLPEHSEILLLDHVGHMGFIEASGKTLQAVKGFAEKLLYFAPLFN